MRRHASPTLRPAFDRRSMLDRLRSEPFDVLVIGGGITGAGVALDAATRGLRTALVERHDFASGTSSKSSKLVHGGLRYLQNGDVRLVYQALHERQRLLHNAPHLVRVLPFMIPVLTRNGVFPMQVAKALGSAMWMYDVTGGWRIGRRHRRLDADDAFDHFPTMHRDRLAGAYLYFDAAADDARLTLAVVRTAAANGAAVANRSEVVSLTTDVAGLADGAVVDTGGELITVRARCVVSAAGVWADQVRALDEPTPPDSIRPAKGVHLTIPWDKVRNDVAVVIPVPKDKRSLFIVPWGQQPDGTYSHAYVGTTDTDHHGSLDDPQCDADDLDYVLRALNHTLTTTVARDDVTAVWSGLRPLVKDAESSRTADLSRHHVVVVSEAGVVRVSGGKLTTYRTMAEDAVDLVVGQLDARRGAVGPDGGSTRGFEDRLRRARLSRPRTKRLPLIGADGHRSVPPDHPDAHLLGRYGSETATVQALIVEEPELGAPLVPGLPFLRAEAVFAARHEMATSVSDVLMRRTRSHLFDRSACEQAAPAVAALLADELSWNSAEVDRQVQDYLAECERERQAAVEPAAAGSGS